MWPIFKYLAGLDLAKAGMIATFSVMLGAGLQPIFGIFSDRGAQRSLILWGVGMASMGVLLGPISLLNGYMSEGAWYLLMLGVMVFVCVGQGMYHPSATSAAGNLAGHRRSTLVSLFIAAGMFGFSISQGLFSMMFRILHGHTEWMLIPAGCILLFGWAWCRPINYQAPMEDTPHPQLRDLAPIAQPLILLFFFEVLVGGMYHGFIFLMPEFLEARNCPEYVVKGGGVFLWVAGSAAIMIPAGHLADRRGGYGILAVFTAAALVFYYILILTPALPYAIILLLLFLAGGTAGAVNPMGVAMGQNLDPRHASLISGILMGLAWATGSPAMWVVGMLAKNPSIGVVGALALLGILGLIGLLLALVLSTVIGRSKPKAVTP